MRLTEPGDRVIPYDINQPGSPYSCERFFRSRSIYRQNGINVREGSGITVTIAGFGDIKNVLPFALQCQRCGRPVTIRIRQATGTAFLGCSSWPKCGHTENLVSPECEREARNWRGFNSSVTEMEAKYVENRTNDNRAKKGLGEITGVYAVDIDPTRAKANQKKLEERAERDAEAALSQKDIAVVVNVSSNIPPEKQEGFLAKLKKSVQAERDAEKKRLEKGLNATMKAIDTPAAKPDNFNYYGKLAREQKTMAALKDAKGKFMSAKTSGDDQSEKEEAPVTDFFRPRMSIGKDIQRRLKKSAYDSRPRVVRMQALTRGKEKILDLLANRVSPETFELIQTGLNTDAGSGAVLGLLGLVAPYVPKVGKDPRVLAVSEEFLTEGMAKGFNQLTDLMALLFEDVITKMAESLPPVSEMVETVKTKTAPRKRKRIAAAPRVRTAPKADVDLDLDGDHAEDPREAPRARHVS